MSRTAATWLVINPRAGHDAVFGRAAYDGYNDLLSVTTIAATSRPSVTTQGAGSDLRALAKLLLFELHAAPSGG